MKNKTVNKRKGEKNEKGIEDLMRQYVSFGKLGIPKKNREIEIKVEYGFGVLQKVVLFLS